MGTTVGFTAEIKKARRIFKRFAEKIGALDRDFKTTQDYIDEYSELDPLLTDFESRLKRFTDIMAEADRHDK